MCVCVWVCVCVCVSVCYLYVGEYVCGEECVAELGNGSGLPNAHWPSTLHSGKYNDSKMQNAIWKSDKAKTSLLLVARRRARTHWRTKCHSWLNWVGFICFPLFPLRLSQRPNMKTLFTWRGRCPRPRLEGRQKDRVRQTISTGTKHQSVCRPRDEWPRVMSLESAWRHRLVCGCYEAPNSSHWFWSQPMNARFHMWNDLETGATCQSPCSPAPKASSLWSFLL